MQISQGAGVVNIALVHPLVTLNVSDHWTRTRVQSNSDQKVVGVILGKQSGRNIEILNTYEVRTVPESSGQSFTIDQIYYYSREVLFKETFPDLDFLGFYVTGDHNAIQLEDVAIQRQAMKFNESPFLLKFNAAEPIECDKLSLNIFESMVDPVDDSQLIFQAITVKIQTGMDEQIGIDHVARFSKVGNDNESVASKLISSQFGAINTFLQQLHITHDYVNAISIGKLQPNDSILNDINKFCQKLSTLNLNMANGTTTSSDQKLLVLLSAITNVEGLMFNLMNKLNTFSTDRYGFHSKKHPYFSRGFLFRERYNINF